VSHTKNAESPDEPSAEASREPRAESFYVGDASEYSEAFLAALEQYNAGDLDGALNAFEALLRDRDGPIGDADVLSVAAAALNRASILSLQGEERAAAAVAAFDSAFSRFGGDPRVTALAASFAAGRAHRDHLARLIRNRRLAWPLAILIYGSCAAATIAIKRWRSGS
jgi:hypothetical protein